MKKLPVTEIFGPVIQGEGQMAGQQTLFIRFAGCDYRCAWCDTLESVLPELIKVNHTRMDEHEVCDHLRDHSTYCRTVTLSGGNPCIHDLRDLVDRLKDLAYFVAVETQGSIWQNWLSYCDLVTISPKPPSSGMVTDWKALDEVISKLQVRQMCLKVVVFDDEDYDYMIKVHKRYPHVPFWCQPGTTPKEFIEPSWGAGTDLQQVQQDILNRTRQLIEKVTHDPILRKVRIMPQLHSLVYGYTRGV